MAVIKNITKGNIISDKAQVAKTFIENILGLLNPLNSRFLVINTRFGIHTFFMKCPIDVILLDEKHEVIKIKPFLKPNSFFFYNPKFKTVIEMPKGTIIIFQININDKISIE